MAARLKAHHALLVLLAAGIFAGALLYFLRGASRVDATNGAIRSENRVEPAVTDAVKLSVDRVDLTGLSPHLATPEHKELFRSSLSESLSHYTSGSGFDVRMFIHQDVLKSTEQPDIQQFEGWGKFTDWFWSSLKLRDGESQVVPAVLAGKIQPQKAGENENHLNGQRTSGLACHREPLSKQFCYEVQVPIEYETPDGTVVTARLGLYFQWSEQSHRWVQSGVSMYGFPVGQPLIRMPG